METIQTRRIYPVLGFLSIITLIYINVGDKFRLPILLQPHMSFVAVNGTHFISADDDIPIYINGWNSYWLMEESIWSSSRIRVSKMLRRGSEMGMTVCRTWGFNDGGHNALQISPGVFDEKFFQALDFVIVEARKYKVRLILSLVNNLNAFGGKAQYVRWAQSAGHNVTSADSFFSHPVIKGYYKNYIKSVLTRKNSLSGVKYSEEPAIFAWELINEPRCSSNSSASILQSWISEMAYYIKSLDPKHLVTVGLEGFYGLKRTDKTGVNPGEWAATLGSDFIDNSAIEHIDFASVHAYPDSWIPRATVEDKIKYLSLWVDSHVSDAEYLLKKPVLFSEVGSSLGQNEQGRPDKHLLVLRTVYDKIYTSAKKRQAGAGALIWQLIVEEVEHYGDEFSLVVWEHPSVYKTIVEQSCRLRYLEENETANRKIHAASNCSHMIP